MKYIFLLHAASVAFRKICMHVIEVLLTFIVPQIDVNILCIGTNFEH